MSFLKCSDDLARIRRASGRNDYRKQHLSIIPAYQRAFSLKPKYMNIVIGKWLKNKEIENMEPVIKSVVELQDTTFEEYVINRFNPYIGMKIEDIQKQLGIRINNQAKNFYAIMSLRILGVIKNKAEEFEKADITIKTIRVNKYNTPKEDISFPYFKYIELAHEEWDTSTLRSSLEKEISLLWFSNMTRMINCIYMV